MTTLKDLLGIEFSNELTEEQLIEAISKLPKEKEVVKTDDAEINRLKKIISERNSEVADYKKKFEARLSEEEKAEVERKAQWDAMEKELTVLKHDKDVSMQKGEYISMGFDSELAQTTAEALVNGDLNTVNQNLKAHLESVKQQVIADAMANTPRPSGTGTGSPATMTKEQFQNLSMVEAMELYQNDPETYKRLNESE